MYVGTTHWCFTLCFLGDQEAEHFYLFIGHLNFPFSNVPVQVLCPFKSSFLFRICGGFEIRAGYRPCCHVLCACVLLLSGLSSHSLMTGWCLWTKRNCCFNVVEFIYWLMIFLLVLLIIASDFEIILRKASNWDYTNFTYLWWLYLYGFIFKIFIYLFGCARSWLWHVGSSSLTRAQTQAPCTGSPEA